MAQTATKIRGIDATYYLAKDIDRATKFYTALLGYAPTLTFGDMGSEWTFPSGETFGLYKPSESPWLESHGVMFGTDDIQETIAACKAQGVEFEVGGKIEDTPVCLMAFGKDPEGNGFILHQRK